jgi:translation initiation factor 2B subunit (eIF-2B alpha/beta/delta family)
MIELDDIKDLATKTATLNRELIRELSKEKLARKTNALRDRLLDAPAEALSLYRVTEIITRRVSIEFAVEIWNITRQQFREILEPWEHTEKSGEPDIDDVIDHLCKVFRDLAAKANQEYRSYAETLHLLKSPANAQRLTEAIEEARSGKLPVFETPAEAKKSLR